MVSYLKLITYIYNLVVLAKVSNTSNMNSLDHVAINQMYFGQKNIRNARCNKNNLCDLKLNFKDRTKQL